MAKIGGEMTIGEFVNLVRKTKCWPYRITAEAYGDIVIITSSIKTADAITGEPIHAGIKKAITAFEIGLLNERAALHLILVHLEKHAIHEIKEFFTVDGKKPFHPQDPETIVERQPMGDRDEYLGIKNLGIKFTAKGKP